MFFVFAYEFELRIKSRRSRAYHQDQVLHIINSEGIVYHQNEVLYIIIAKAKYSLRLMRYTLARDDIPLLSQWIKKSTC